MTSNFLCDRLGFQALPWCGSLFLSGFGILSISLGDWGQLCGEETEVEGERNLQSPSDRDLSLTRDTPRGSRCQGNCRASPASEHARRGPSARHSFRGRDWWISGQSEKPVGRGGDEQCPGEGVPTVSLPDFRVAVLAGSARLVASFPLPAVCSRGNRGSSSSS